MPLKHLECDNSLENKNDPEENEINNLECSCKHRKGKAS